MTRLFNVVAIVGCLSTSAFAEEQQISVSAIDSGRLYADYTFGDCCSLDAWDSQPNPIWTDNCGTMGGYCSAGRDVANWMFQIPELPEGTELLEVRLKVYRQSGSAGNATLKIRGSDSSGLGIGSAQQAYSSPDHSQTAYFSSGLLHTFVLPMSYFVDPDHEPYLIVSIYRSSALGLFNSGIYAPKLDFAYENPTPPCPSDLDGNDIVDAADLGIFLALWDTTNADADLNEDGIVGSEDLGLLLSAWGQCP